MVTNPSSFFPVLDGIYSRLCSVDLWRTGGSPRLPEASPAAASLPSSPPLQPRRQVSINIPHWNLVPTLKTRLSALQLTGPHCWRLSLSSFYSSYNIPHKIPLTSETPLIKHWLRKILNHFTFKNIKWASFSLILKLKRNLVGSWGPLIVSVSVKSWLL